MTYTISRADLASISDVELAFGTTKYLPDEDELPLEFRRGNQYSCLATAIFCGSKLPPGEIVFKEGFGDVLAPAELNKCVRAHLRSFEPKHEHKIAGVGFLIAQVCTFLEEK